MKITTNLKLKFLLLAFSLNFSLLSHLTKEKIFLQPFKKKKNKKKQMQKTSNF
jgi:hypothetical protein